MNKWENDVKKILFVINTLGCGGAERAMIDLFSLLKQEKYEISLFVLTGQGELIKELPKEVHLLNKDYKNISVLTKEGRRLLLHKVLHAGILKGKFFSHVGYLLKNFRNMQRKGAIQVDKLCWRILSDAATVFDEEYDLAVAYLEGGSTYYVADHVKAKKKAAFVHIDYAQAGYDRNLDLGCYESYDRIFTVSKEVSDHFFKVYPEYKDKVKVFHNMIDQKRVLNMAKMEAGFTDHFDGYRILTVGRLTAQKRYDLAILAMARLKKIHDLPVRWYVLGEGELRGELEKQIHSLGLDKDFILLGVKDNPFPYFKSCDLYVHATGFEGKSIAIQEAQTLGKPILATNCNGNKEQIIDGVDGKLCDLTSESISESILWMIQHPNECKTYGRLSKEKQLYDRKEVVEFTKLLG